MSSRKKALGRGLGSLLSPPSMPVDEEKAKDAPPPVSPGEARELPEHRVAYLRTVEILPNPRQPRHSFDAESLQELADSIKHHGVLQPVLVVYDKKEGCHVLLAGERRLRAAQLAGIEKIPAIVTKATDEEMLEIAIVENVQRDDLNAVEEARAYRSLIEQFAWTQEQIAQRVGKKRTTVTNALRLLKLGDDAIKDLEEGRITPGHARAILSVEDGFQRQRLRHDIIRKGLSVREAERRAIAAQKEGSPVGQGRKKKDSTPEGLDIVALQDRLMDHLGCRVRIRTRDGKSGTLEVPFQNPEELDRFLDAVGFTSE